MPVRVRSWKDGRFFDIIYVRKSYLRIACFTKRIYGGRNETVLSERIQIVDFKQYKCVERERERERE